MPQGALADIRIGDVLDDATRRLALVSDEARIESEVLLADALRCSRASLVAGLREPITLAARDAFEATIVLRLRREPLAYIRGRREFFGLNIACDRRALIPRPETELLVEIGIDVCGNLNGARVADVGTGTGAIAVAVAVHAPNAQVTAIDASPDALGLAGKNVRAHGLESRIALITADLLGDAGEFDVILANLPYVSQDEWAMLPPELREHEPLAAFVGGRTGTEVVERLLREAPSHLAPGGVLACEIGHGQGAQVLRAASAAFPSAGVSLQRDLAGLERVVVVRREQA